MLGLFLLGMSVLAALVLGFVLLTAFKALLWVVLLPIRLVFHVAFGILFLPFLLLKLLFGGVLALVAIPFLLVGMIVAIIGAAVPLLPLLFVCFVVWLLFRASDSTAIART
jgi:hypothetical protein